MNEIAIRHDSGTALVPVDQIRARTAAIKKLISEAMVENVDFGLTPGTQKKSLWKPGAEKICMMFRIADSYSVEDLSSGNVIRYRVTCRGVSASGEILGECLGEASTAEDKYRWRRAVCDEEFDETPEPMRRTKYMHGKNGGHYKVKQIMTNEADSANTILKMAQKRAKLGMVIAVTACSDDFTQDVVDDDDAPDVGREPPADRTPKRKSSARAPAASAAADDLTGERAWITNRVKAKGLDMTEVLRGAGIATLEELTREIFDALKADLR